MDTSTIENGDEVYSRCLICKDDIDIDSASEVESVYSNVRRFSHMQFTIWRCPSCNSIHAKDSVNLDFFYKNYPMQNQKLDYGTLSAFRTRLKYLYKYGLKSNSKILDFGCSNGLFVEFLKNSGFDATGYDPYVDRYSNENVLKKKYDVVVTYDVIEHVANPRDFIKDMANLLIDDGVLVIGTPNATEIDLQKKDIYALELHQPYHRHILSQEVLIHMGIDYGFSLLKLRRRFCFDTFYPFINTQFIWRYIRAAGNHMDVAIDMPKFKNIIKQPMLIFWGLFGYVFPHRGSMIAIFRKNSFADKG